MNDLSQSMRAFLEEKRFGVLATINQDGSVQQSVIWYELIDQQIIMNTKLHRLKDRNLRRDQRVSLCVEDGYRWIAIRGRVTLIDGQDVAQADIERLAVRYHDRAKAQEQMRSQFSKEHRVTIVLPLERIAHSGF